MSMRWGTAERERPERWQHSGGLTPWISAWHGEVGAGRRDAAPGGGPNVEDSKELVIGIGIGNGPATDQDMTRALSEFCPEGEPRIRACHRLSAALAVLARPASESPPGPIARGSRFVSRRSPSSSTRPRVAASQVCARPAISWPPCREDSARGHSAQPRMSYLGKQGNRRT